MSRIRSKHTKPELMVRKILFNLGFRYRLHAKNLEGKPDIVNIKKHIAIFVNGCFWHQHAKCTRSSMPKSNLDYWKPKLARNVKAQQDAINKLKVKSYTTLVYWECETKNISTLISKIKEDLKIAGLSFKS